MYLVHKQYLRVLADGLPATGLGTAGWWHPFKTSEGVSKYWGGAF